MTNLLHQNHFFLIAFSLLSRFSLPKTPSLPFLPFFTGSLPSDDGTDRRSFLRVAPTLAYSPLAWNGVEQGRKCRNQLLNRTSVLRFHRRFGRSAITATSHQLGHAQKLPHLARSRLNSAIVGLLQLVQFELEICSDRRRDSLPDLRSLKLPLVSFIEVESSLQLNKNNSNYSCPFSSLKP